MSHRREHMHLNCSGNACSVIFFQFCGRKTPQNLPSVMKTSDNASVGVFHRLFVKKDKGHHAFSRFPQVSTGYFHNFVEKCTVFRSFGELRLASVEVFNIFHKFQVVFPQAERCWLV